MKRFFVTLLLAAALVVPPVMFWFLVSRTGVGMGATSVAAVVAGWALNVAWAFAAEMKAREEEQGNADGHARIALRFGWVCPAVLVLLTWLVWRFIAS